MFGGGKRSLSLPRQQRSRANLSRRLLGNPQRRPRIGAGRAFLQGFASGEQ